MHDQSAHVTIFISQKEMNNRTRADMESEIDVDSVQDSLIEN